LLRIVTILPAFVFGVGYVWHRVAIQEYRSFNSPDGRFVVTVFRDASWFAMPGQSGDSSGLVVLADKKTGRVIRRHDVDMVQRIDQLAWSSTNVDIKLFADWNLPQ
jgi:hypothetical protein